MSIINFRIFFEQRLLQIAVLAMIFVTASSNILVQYQINEWLTWGAFTYPFVFLVSDLVNRRFGPSLARQVAWIGLSVVVVISIWLATPRIALAAGTAFIMSQILDIFVFNKLRNQRWWRAPLFATIIAAILDTFIFFSIAFFGINEDWFTLALGDLSVKLILGTFLLLPFRLLMGIYFAGPPSFAR